MYDTAYSGWEEFDAADYAGLRHAGKIADIDRALIIEAVRVMKRMGLEPECFQHVADIGAGSNLYPAMLLAPFVATAGKGGQFDLIEYSPSNLRYLQDTIAARTTSPPASIWQKYEDLMAECNPVWRKAFSTVQGAASIMYGDIFSLRPESYDAVSSFFVSESITDSIDECERAIASLLASVKSGGFVMIGHMLGSAGYPAGADTLFTGLALTSDDLRRMYGNSLDDLSIIESSVTAEGHGRYRSVLVIGRKKISPTIILDDSLEKIFTANGTQDCLYDEQRVAHLKRAIFETVRPGDVVVDAGSGTGVLGLIAAQAGASRVYCIEPNGEYINVIKRNARGNGMQGKIITVQGDATKIDLPESVDVIICEVISSGFFYEPQLQIMQNMRRFLKPAGRAVPAVMDNFVELIDAQDELYGLNFRHDTRYCALRDVMLTTKAKYFSADFLKNTPLSVDAGVLLRCITSGKANAIRVSYAIWFSDGILGTEPTDVLLNPQIIFLEEPLWLRAGEYYRVTLKYEASASPLSCRITLRREEAPAQHTAT